jgi:menaquinone-dependent protoporphyrinogen oxidase
MAKNILITYASRTGSTAGVAEAIGKVLEEQGMQITVSPMSQVQNLTIYDAVVAGSAIHAATWLPEALQFVQQNQVVLRQKPFAAFLVCMTLALKNKTYHAIVADMLAPVRTLVKPVSEGYFSGVLDIRKIPSFGDRLKFRLSIAMGVWEAGDHRDWNAIRAWASDLPLIGKNPQE